MYFPKPEKRKMKPILHANELLHKRIEKCIIDDESLRVENACLLKYFPKYYKTLYLPIDGLSQAVKSKAKKLKIVRHCYLSQPLTKLLQSSRKTLKSLPEIHYDYAECVFWRDFPNVKTFQLEKTGTYYFQYSPKLDKFSGFYQPLWKGSRIENLEAGCCDQSDLFRIKEINKSKQFFSCLKRLQLYLDMSRCQESFEEILVELFQNQNFLRHVTHCNYFSNRQYDWKLIQSIINCCPQLSFLSVVNEIKEEFCLDLSYLLNLPVLDVQVKNLKNFAEKINFPSFLKKVTMDIVDDEISEVFDSQDSEDGVVTLEDQDARDFVSFEKYKVLSGFFEKWRKMDKLLILNLSISYLSKTDILRNFVLPLLNAVPQLEIFNFSSLYEDRFAPQAKKTLDLGVLFSGIGSLKCLKRCRISTGPFINGVFSGLQNLQKSNFLANLSSLVINVKFDPNFGFKDFLKRLLNNDNFKSENNLAVSKNLKFLQVCVSSAEDFVRILNLMHSVSHIKNLQIELQIYLIVWCFEDISSNFRYPINVAKNIQTTAHIYFQSFEVREWASEHEEYFKRIFGQLEFTVNKALKYEFDIDSFYPQNLNRNVFMESKLREVL